MFLGIFGYFLFLFLEVVELELGFLVLVGKGFVFFEEFVVVLLEGGLREILLDLRGFGG